uniref:Uncharacterized protein LOC114335663 n=1 Tax=Diabrotica virgifera virgifera TaxID=50390 RepID=A0A6P7GBK3_DIAVI
MVDIGAYGKDNDAGVFDTGLFRRAIECGKIKVPAKDFLPNSNIKAPFVLLGDSAFPLKTYLLKPFPDANTVPVDDKDRFNYRLSRARMVVVCSFGSIASKFGILSRPIATDVDNAIHIVKAITIIHNISRDLEAPSNQTSYSTTFQRQQSLRRSRRYNASTREALQTRDLFLNFFKHN